MGCDQPGFELLVQPNPATGEAWVIRRTDRGGVLSGHDTASAAECAALAYAERCGCSVVVRDAYHRSRVVRPKTGPGDPRRRSTTHG